MLSMIDQSGGRRLLSRLKQAKDLYTEQLSATTMSDQIFDERGRLVQEKERHWRDGGGSNAMNGVSLMGKKGLLEQIKVSRVARGGTNGTGSTTLNPSPPPQFSVHPEAPLRARGVLK
jgi:hypothetical protein